MAGVPETLRTGSCLPQHVNLPYMQEGEREVVVEGDLRGAAAGPREHPGPATASEPCGPHLSLDPPSFVRRGAGR